MTDQLNLKLKIWRQKNKNTKGELVDYDMKGISTEMSFLEMLDTLNSELEAKGEEPVAFDHDCREGICGACSLVVNGRPHGPDSGTTVCQLHMRRFENNDTIVIEPWRATAFPIIKDLVVDRSAFDRIISAGGYVTARTGSAPDANAVLVAKPEAELSMDAAACIGCGACVAACKNASAMLFVSAKVSHLGLLPQGRPEAKDRVLRMVEAMDDEGFGACTNTRACEVECPKEIKLENIARLNREWVKASICKR
ncbi:MAG: succinate dehydrogenase/fumarate reductase iron-sulfur subunit [Acidobacteria bacterium]|nr:succinate dehydrogenase/fumarate reductase iron-sulfur subunit [Acidobacteriota bacterium]